MFQLFQQPWARRTCARSAATQPGSIVRILKQRDFLAIHGVVDEFAMACRPS
jgi:hypothetical protein